MTSPATHPPATNPPAGLDADLGDAIAAGRHGPPPADLAAFEATFMALVEAGAPEPERAWDAFYDRTLARVEGQWGVAAGTGNIATFSRIWARAATLARGSSVLDVGTCFGFLPLAWAARPGAPALLAVELSPASAALAARQARRLGRSISVLCADGTQLPLRDRAVSTVLVLHVLEHLDGPAAERLLSEGLRVADRRVVVAVPIESRPDPLFGHLQVFDLAGLAERGRRTGWQVSLADADGAWLVLDRR